MSDMLANCKHLFSIPDEITYLNCAYMGPLLKSTEQAGIVGLRKKATPWTVSTEDFFAPVDELKSSFAQLVDCGDPERIALVPSASYGLANAIQNLTPKKGGNIILVEHQFPSNVYPWQKWAARHHVNIHIVKPNRNLFSATDSINYEILAHIDKDTIAVGMSHVHWADGRLFDLKAIREKTERNHAMLILDGTQSVGALPFSVEQYKPDALIVAGYKWLLGPYSFGLAYYSDRFDHGNPIEENWINRKDSHVFQKLVNYQVEYRPKANRFNVGENSNFIAVPMLSDSIKQIADWGVDNIQSYVKGLVDEVSDDIINIGCNIETDSKRSSHLFGIYLSPQIQMERLKRFLKEEKIFVSFRGDFIRVSPHVYNTVDDLKKLVSIIEKSIQK